MKETYKTTLLATLAAGLLGYASPVSATPDLLHRWSFNDAPGTTVSDSVGGPTYNGTLRRVTTNGVPAGSVPTLGGGYADLDGIGGYVDLPNGLVSGLTNVTFELWVTWWSGGGNQRLFDFGSMTTNGVQGVEDPDGTLRSVGSSGDSYIFCTPDTGTAGDANGWMRFAATEDYPSGYPLQLIDPLEFLSAQEVHIVCTYDQNGWMRTYFDGIQSAAGYSTNLVPLSAINDVNDWLGRSQWNGDPMLEAYIHEFRIHGSVLTAQEVAASTAGGEDAVDYNPGTASSVTISGVKNSMVVGNVQVPTFSASFSDLVNPVDPLEPPDMDSLTSSAPGVVLVEPSGRLVAVGAGQATITATIGSATDSVVINVSASNPTLKNRWSFNDSPGSSTVLDSVGGQSGTVVASSTTNVTLTGTQVSFPGVPTATAPYIDIPDGIISSKTNVTIEVWFSWPAVINNTRVFDFGNSTKTNANDGSGTEVGTMALVPSAGGQLRAVVRTNYSGGTAINLYGTQPSVNVEHHVAYVFAPDSLLSRLYLDGVVQASGTAPFPLSAVPDVNNWLGLSQWGQDPGFNGSIDELRIYEGVLSDLDIALHRSAGPDVPNVSAPGNLVSLSVPDVDWLLGESGSAQAKLLATFQNYTNVEIEGLSGVSMVSQDTNVFTTTSAGLMTQVGVGSAGLVGSYQGMSATGTVTVLGPVSIAIDAFGGPLTAGVQTNAVLRANFTTTNNVDVTTFDGVVWSTLDPTVATVNQTGVVSPVLEGSTTLRAVYGGLTNDLVITVQYPPGYVPYRIDDFQSYGLGDFNTNAIPPWTTSETGNFGSIGADGTNQFLTFWGNGDYRDFRKAAPWSLSTVGTLSFDVYIATETNLDNAFGLTHNSGMNWYDQYGPYVRVTTDDGGDANGKVALDTRDDTGFVDNIAYLNTNQWYHIKLVIDTSGRGGIGSFDIYVDGSQVYANSGFRYHYAFPLDYFVLMAGSGINGSNVRVDNIYLTPPTNPELSVRRSGADVIISWPTNDTSGFMLEGTTILGSGASWSNAGIPAPSVVGDQYQVILTAPTGTGYYRLKQ